MNLRQSWHETTQDLLNLLFPPRCVACQQSGDWLCPACQQGIQFVKPPVCPLCGQATALPRLCRSCRRDPPHIDGIRAVGYLEGTLRTAVHRFKYSNIRPLTVQLGRLLNRYLRDNQLPADVVVPVPLHPDRLKERGYNQAALLAKEMVKGLDLPVAEEALVRSRITVPQVGLTARQRRENVEGAFCCTDTSLEGRRVLLIDDVCTTGATLEACSIALRPVGVASVWGLVLARERWSSGEEDDPLMSGGLGDGNDHHWQEHGDK